MSSSSLFLKVSVSGAETISSGSLFQMGTTRNAKKFSLMDSLDLWKNNFLEWPRSCPSVIEKSAHSFKQEVQSLSYKPLVILYVSMRSPRRRR